MTVELVTNVAYTLCQNITLEADINFILTATMVTEPTATYSVITAHLNSAKVMNISSGLSDDIVTKTEVVVPKESFNQLCFSQQHVSLQPHSGPCLDDVILVRAPEVLIEIEFEK